MTVSTKSDDEKIECFFDSILDKETFTLTIPSGRFGLVVIQIDRTDLPELVDTLQKFQEFIKIATGR